MEAKTQSITKELAVDEIKKYLSDFVETEFDVEKDYPKILNAVIDGRLVLGESGPVYSLINPINVGTEFEQHKLEFKTRVLPSTGANLAKGIDLKNDQITYGLIVTAHITGFANHRELDKLSKKDFQLVQELAPVFM